MADRQQREMLWCVKGNVGLPVVNVPSSAIAVPPRIACATRYLLTSCFASSRVI